jgi:hypothetical protein
MASALRLNYHPLVDSQDPARGCGRLVLVPGLARGVNEGRWLTDVVAKDRHAIDAWTEAGNDLGGLAHAIPVAARRIVLDAA